MKAVPLTIPDVMLLEPRVFGDARGFFFESFKRMQFLMLTGREEEFVQDNHSRSAQGVLRGLHYQLERPLAKLVRVARGAIYDVAVDLRKSSRTFGCWVGAFLSAENRKQLWIPEGFAHGFQVISQTADVLYKTNDYYFPEHERCIRWNDPAIGINWPLATPPILSDKDRNGPLLAHASAYKRKPAPRQPEHEPWTPPPACAGQGTSPCGS